MKLERQHPDAPAANARIGDEVLYRAPKSRRWLSGIVAEVGISNDRGYKLNIGVRLEGAKVPTVVSPFDQTHDPKGPRILVFPPFKEIKATASGRDLFKFAEDNKLAIVRDGGNTDEARYRLVSKKGYHELQLIAKDVQSASLSWTEEYGLSNGKLSMEDSENFFIAGNRVVEQPEGFEPNW